MSARTATASPNWWPSEGLDVLIVGDLVRPGDSGPDGGADIRWLTGFGGTSGLAIVGDGNQVSFTDFRYEERPSARSATPSNASSSRSRLAAELAERLHGQGRLRRRPDQRAQLERPKRSCPTASSSLRRGPGGAPAPHEGRGGDRDDRGGGADHGRGLRVALRAGLCRAGPSARSRSRPRCGCASSAPKGPRFRRSSPAGTNAAIPHHEAERARGRRGRAAPDRHGLAGRAATARTPRARSPSARSGRRSARSTSSSGCAAGGPRRGRRRRRGKERTPPRAADRGGGAWRSLRPRSRPRRRDRGPRGAAAGQDAPRRRSPSVTS